MEQIFIRGAAVAMFFSVAAPLTHAAHLLHIDSSWTGDDQSNGTQIVAEIGFPPGETSVEIEVRAFELIGDKNQLRVPIKSRTCADRDQAGNFVSRTIAHRSRQVASNPCRGFFRRQRRRVWNYPTLIQTEFVHHSVRVLDSQLALTPGTHKIALLSNA